MKGVFISSLMIAYAAGACLNGWVPHGGECYLFSHDLETWAAAMEICQIFGASLVEVETAAEDTFLRTQMRNRAGNYWIGLTDLSQENTFEWMTSFAKLTSESFKNWQDNQPDNDDNNENCVHYWFDDGDRRWNDFPCSTKQKYICEQFSESGSVIIG